jgi:hypothetical protein
MQVVYAKLHRNFYTFTVISTIDLKNHIIISYKIKTDLYKFGVGAILILIYRDNKYRFKKL